MSYTNTSVIWEAHGAQDDFGDMSYGPAQSIMARKQPRQEIVKTAEGKEILSKSYFYLDPRIEPKTLEVSKMDRLDGELVMERYEMCDLSNKPKMIRLITV